MVLIRPVTLDDLPQLVRLAALTGVGLTTLPQDRRFLEQRIRESRRAFEKLDEDPLRGEGLLLVLEDLATGLVVGTSGIVSKVGGFEPFYAYRVETELHVSEFLGVRREVPTLQLVAEHSGPCEVCSLFLDPTCRQAGSGRLLSLSRFLLMAEHAPCFDPVVIAEMRGVIDEQGQSPFWDAVGRHFFDIDFPKADYLSVVNKKFIADLMPRHPIYVPLLPEAARAVIGQVHEQTRPALHILEQEGFAFSGMVDIFEAGPIVRCALKDIRSVRESRRACVAEMAEQGQEGPVFVVARVQGEFRACLGRLAVLPSGQVRLEPAAAAALGVEVGQTVRFVSLKAASAGATAS